MPWHPDILDERDPLKRSLLGSIGLHAGIFALAAAYYWTGGLSRTERWGDPNSLGGGAVGITPVDKIPLPQRQGRVNPVANDTESQVPAQPKPQPKKAEAPDPDAVALKTKNAKKAAPERQSPQKYTPLRDPKPNQVYSSTGQAVNSPMFSQAAGGGGVGSGSKSPFGYRFAWYEQLLRDTVARNWRSQELDSNIRNRVAVTFDIMRDGNIRNVRVSTSSGNFALDQSAQRAILMSNPLRPLPPEFERDVATIEFWFALQQSQ
jgi:periplasmic protein TonB